MGAPFSVVVAFVLSIAAAANLPISATYGTSEACKLFADGGESQVYALANGDALLFEPEGLTMHEVTCYPTAAARKSGARYRIRLKCGGDDMNPQATFMNVIMQEDQKAATLFVKIDKEPSLMLVRCR